MKPNNAGIDIQFRAIITNQKLKRNERRQDADDMQSFSVLYMTQLEAISQQ